MTDFQVGDRVRTKTATVVGFAAGPDGQPRRMRVTVAYDDQTEATYHSDYLTLVERPRRKLRVGSVWEHAPFGTRHLIGRDDDENTLVIGLDGRGSYPRNQTSIDTHPQNWREVPVEELEREAS